MEVEVNGNKILISHEDQDLFAKYKWYFHGKIGNQYLATKLYLNKKQTTTFLHRLIAVRAGLISNVSIKLDNRRIDHINNNQFDNQRYNLRIATGRQNIANSKVRCNITKSSRYKGVHWSALLNKWIAKITIDGKTTSQRFKGDQEGEIQAARAYDDLMKKHLKEYARLNFPPTARLSNSLETSSD